MRLLRAPCDVQEEDKDLDDINIEGKGSEDIFLRADGVRSVSNEQLSVVGQKQGEDYCSTSTIQHVQPGHILKAEYNGCDDASHQDNHTKSTEQTCTGGEVNLGLKTEDCDDYTHYCCDPQGQEHRFCVKIT